MEIKPEPFDDFYMLEIPIVAGVDSESKGRSSIHSDTSKALFLPPRVRFTSTWRQAYTQQMLRVKHAEVLQRWQMMTGDNTAVDADERLQRPHSLM